MDHQSKLRVVLDSLLKAVHTAPHSRVRTRRMTYKEVPWDNRLVYAGVSLQEIMVPDVPADPVSAMAVFDAWAYSHLVNEGIPEDAVAQFGGEVLRRWLCNFNGAGTRAVMLLWALGHAVGAEVCYDEKAIVVHHGEVKYGIINGKVTSRFCEGMSLSIPSPKVILNETRMTRTFSTKFITLYREAYRDGASTIGALIGLTRAYPELDLWRLAQRHEKYRKPYVSKLRRWERILIGHDDPLMHVYRDMVPYWVTAQVYTRIFGQLKRRKLEPGPLERQQLITKMYAYFYKTKEEQQ